MQKYLVMLLSYIVLGSINSAYAQVTQRTSQFSNDQVNVWKTVIYPASNQALSMHRHEYDRVVVALSDGLLKITNDKGKTHYWKLEKNKAYYLTNDPAGELHKDENMTSHPITVMVIELKNRRS